MIMSPMRTAKQTHEHQRVWTSESLHGMFSSTERRRISPPSPPAKLERFLLDEWPSILQHTDMHESFWRKTGGIQKPDGAPALSAS